MQQQIEQTLDSREVAEMVGKKHTDLMRDIKRYLNQMEKINCEDPKRKIAFSDFFIESSYNAEGQKRTYPCYLVTKKGCEFIAHKLTGQKGTEFTATYINRFHEMEGALEAKAAPMAIQQFMERQQSLMEELVKMNRSMSDRLAALETRKGEPDRMIVASGPKPFTVAEDENISRKKKLNMLVTQMAKAYGWSRSFTLHRLYKTLEEVLDINIDNYVAIYKEEVQGDACAIDAVAAYENLYVMAVRLCNNTLNKLNIEGA